MVGVLGVVVGSVCKKGLSVKSSATDFVKRFIGSVGV